MRLFIALVLPETARADLAALQLRFSTGRAVPQENLHLTLAFLGDQTEETAEAVHDALDHLRAPALSLSLAQGTVFGGRHGQAVGIEAEGGRPLAELHDRIQSRLRGAGVLPERRRFRPHVTLARLKGHSDASPLIRALTGVTLGPYLCTAFALYASTLHRDGAIHEELARYTLTP